MEKLIIANWKDYVTSKKQADGLFELAENKLNELGKNELIICPSLSNLNEQPANLKIKLGAQDFSLDNLSEMSPEKLKKLKVKYAIIGHSSQRALGETDTTINKKIKLALENNFKIILCVGESISIREKGLKAVKTFIKNQLELDLKDLYTLYPIPYTLILAYEPIWAITTGDTKTPDDPQQSIEIIKFIREFLQTTSYKLQTTVLYGGSINSKNITSFLSSPEIDGVLIGKASTQKAEFSKILRKF